MLRLWWDTDEDVFLFKINKEHFTREPPTKGSVLKYLSLFGPIGFSVKAENFDAGYLKHWMIYLEKICRIRISRSYSINIPVAEKIAAIMPSQVWLTYG